MISNLGFCIQKKNFPSLVFLSRRDTPEYRRPSFDCRLKELGSDINSTFFRLGC
jgi:hypothetical protein